MRMSPGRWTAHPACLLALFCSRLLCCQSPPSVAVSGKAYPLAIVDGQVLVTVEDLEAELRQSPSSPSHPIDQFREKALLHGLIQFELLSREAEKAGLENDDEVQRQKKKAMVNRFVEDKLNKDPRARSSSEEDLKAFYEKHKDEFVSPERFRVQVVQFAALGDGGVTPGDAAKAFADLGAAGGEQAPANGGGPSWMTLNELIGVYGATLAQTVSSLKVNQVSDPIHGLRGWYIVKLSGRQEPQKKSFEQVKAMVRGRADSERRASLAEDYAQELDRRSNWQANDAALAGIDAMHLPGQREPPPPVTPQ